MPLDFSLHLPNYAEWMKNTQAGPLTPRSGALKKLDDAMRTQNEVLIGPALHAWQVEQQKTNGDWKKSERNKFGIVQLLDDYLNKTQRKHLTDEEKEMVNYIDASQIEALSKQFAHCKLVYGKGTAGALASSAGSKLDKIKAAAKMKGPAAAGAVFEIQSGLSDAINKVGSAIPNCDFTFILEHIGLPTVGEIAKNITPFIGVIKSGVTLCRGLGNAGLGVVQGVQLHQAGPAVRQGDSAAAMDAIQDILKEEMAFNAAKTTVAGAAFAGKVGGLMADFGTVTTAGIGLAETLATIFLEVTEFCVQYRKFLAGNEHLAHGVIDKDLFETCPLLGAYYAALQPQSTIVNFNLAYFGMRGWMDQYDRLRKQASVVRELAFKYIQQSKYQLEGQVEVVTPSGTTIETKTYSVSNQGSTSSKLFRGANTALGMIPEGPSDLLETGKGAKEGVVGLIRYIRKPKAPTMVGYGMNGPGNRAPIPP